MVVVVLVALAIRVYPIVADPELDRGGLGPFGDSYLYAIVAANVCTGGGFAGADHGPEIVRPPLYPLFVCAIFRLTGTAPDALRAAATLRPALDRVRLAQAVLDAIVCVLVFLIVRTIRPSSPWTATLAAGLYAVGPYNVFYTRALLAETLTTFLVTAALLLSVLGSARAAVRWWALAGLALGLAALARVEYVLFVPVIAVCAAAVRRDGSGHRRVAAVVAAALATLAPWLARNAIVFGRPFTIAEGSFGYSLFVGTYESSTNWEGWGVLPRAAFPDADERIAVESLYASHDALFRTGSPRFKDVDDEFRRRALARIRAAPWRHLGLWIGRIPRLWYQRYVPMYRDQEASGRWMLAYWLCAATAVVRASRDERRLMTPVLLLAAYLTLLFLPLHIEPRYCVPSIPAIVALAGLGAAEIAATARRAAGRR
jgi:4-amino-4-deoxy-L-arabinose transferase-like glycosyltransferase